MLLSIVADAHEFVVNGIYYNKLNGNEVEVTYKGSSPNYSSYHYSGSIEIPSTITFQNKRYTVTRIGDYAFYNCDGVNDVTIPYSIISLGQDAFFDCDRLTNIVIPNSITTIGEDAFYSCDDLISVEIPSSVIAIGSSAFYGCNKLSRVSISDLDAWYRIKFSNASSNPCYCAHHLFVNGVELTEVTIPESVTSIGTALFSGCSCITRVKIPNTVTSIGDYAFNRCESLTSIEIPNTVTRIGNSAFLSSGIRGIEIPSSVSVIGNSAFYDCNGSRGITSITIFSDIDSIGDYAFAYYYPYSYSYTIHLELYGNIKYIGTGIFDDTREHRPRHIHELIIGSDVDSVENLGVDQSTSSNIYCYNRVPPIANENTFLTYDATLHVPATSLATYFTAPYWSNFNNIVGDAVEPIGLTISSDFIEMQIGGEPVKLTASVSPTNATPNSITWKSTDTTIATVDNGIVTPISSGECDIVAQCLSKKAVCHVIVNDTTVTIMLDQHELRIQPNEMITLTPTSSINILPELAVTSSDPTVAAARVANDKIQIVGVKVGYAVITVGSVDGLAIPDTCLVTVYSNSNEGDVNGDGEVNIADVNAIIDMILSGFSNSSGDVNGDGEVNIADVNAVIDKILTSNNK